MGHGKKEKEGGGGEVVAGLGAFLETHPEVGDVVREARGVVELGTGSGAGALAAAACGVGERVIPTDGFESALELARRNVELARQTGEPYADRLADPLYLLWGGEGGGVGEDVDVVLAADVAYRREIVADLMVTVGNLAPRLFVYAQYPRGFTVADQQGIDDQVWESARLAGYSPSFSSTPDADGGFVVLFTPMAGT